MTPFAVAARLFNVILFGGALGAAGFIMLSPSLLMGLSAQAKSEPEKISRELYLVAMISIVGLTLELLR